MPAGLSYLAVGTLGRLTGLAPMLLPWPALLVPLVLGGIWSLAAQRRRSSAATARLCDRILDSEDVLVTAATIRTSIPANGFQQVVLAQAQRRIGTVTPHQVLPWRMWPGLLRWGTLFAAMVVVIAAVPVRDPFGRRQHLREIAARHGQLEQQDREIRQRTAEIAASRPDDPTSTAVAQELAKIQAQLEQMKPGSIPANHQLLSQDHADLKQSMEQLRTARFDSSIDPKQVQELGMDADQEAAQALASALEHGQAASTQQAIDQVMALADQMRTASPVDQTHLAEQLDQKLATLAQAGSGQPSGLSAAIQHAIDSLAQSGSPEMRDQALQNLQDALELAKMAAGADAQSARDIADLQEALKALHLADQLNDKGALDPASAKDLDDYADLYAQRLAEMQQGRGRGNGRGQDDGSGSGDGARTDSSMDQADVDAKYEGAQEHSPVRAGATIAEWHIHGPADPGKVIDDYQSTLGDIKQDLPEALEREQVPEAYHAGVKKYFDGLQPHP